MTSRPSTARVWLARLIAPADYAVVPRGATA